MPLPFLCYHTFSRKSFFQLFTDHITEQFLIERVNKMINTNASNKVKQNDIEFLDFEITEIYKYEPIDKPLFQSLLKVNVSFEFRGTNYYITVEGNSIDDNIKKGEIVKINYTEQFLNTEHS